MARPKIPAAPAKPRKTSPVTAGAPPVETELLVEPEEEEAEIGEAVEVVVAVAEAEVEDREKVNQSWVAVAS